MYNKAFLSYFSRGGGGGRCLYNPCWKGSFMSSPWSNRKISLTNYPSPFSYIIGQQVVKVMLRLSSFCPVSITKWLTEGRAAEQQAEATLHLDVGLCCHVSKHLLFPMHPWTGHHNSFKFCESQTVAGRQPNTLTLSIKYHIIITHSKTLFTWQVAHACGCL